MNSSSTESATEYVGFISPGRPSSPISPPPNVVVNGSGNNAAPAPLQLDPLGLVDLRPETPRPSSVPPVPSPGDVDALTFEEQMEKALQLSLEVQAGLERAKEEEEEREKALKLSLEVHAGLERTKEEKEREKANQEEKVGSQNKVQAADQEMTELFVDVGELERQIKATTGEEDDEGNSGHTDEKEK